MTPPGWAVILLGFLIAYGAVLIQSHLIVGVIVLGGGVAGVFGLIAWLLLRP